MTVHWTQQALRQLTAIHDYISADSPRYAQKMVDRITRRSEQIAAFPLSGCQVPEYGDPTVREMLEYPYRIIYLVNPDSVNVLSVIHGARQLPPLEQ